MCVSVWTHMAQQECKRSEHNFQSQFSPSTTWAQKYLLSHLAGLRLNSSLLSSLQFAQADLNSSPVYRTLSFQLPLPGHLSCFSLNQPTIYQPYPYQLPCASLLLWPGSDTPASKVSPEQYPALLFLLVFLALRKLTMAGPGCT